MYEFCLKHGEGQKSYLRAKNCSTDLLCEYERARVPAAAHRGREDRPEAVPPGERFAEIREVRVELPADLSHARDVRAGWPDLHHGGVR